MDRVLHKLKDLGRVPRDCTRRQGHPQALWMLSSTTKELVGRHDEVEVVLASLRDCGAAVIWGGPGEGKTTVAMEAAAQLREREPALSAFEVDMRGELGHRFCRHLTRRRNTCRCASMAYVPDAAIARSGDWPEWCCAGVQGIINDAIRTPASAPGHRCFSASSMPQCRWRLSTCGAKCAVDAGCSSI